VVDLDYLDFELEVSPDPSSGYRVTVLRSPAGEATGSMRLPFDSLALQNRLQALQIALLRSGGTRRRVDSPEVETVRRFGEELFRALFSGDILGRLEVSRSEARQREQGVRLKLRFTSPELAALPWEYLYDPHRGDFLALSVATPLVRYIPMAQPMDPLIVTPPLRILGMVVSPKDLPELDTERERQRIEVAVADLREQGLVELEWLPKGTWRELQHALRRPPWHIFHFVGHGSFDEIRAEGNILLVDERGRAQRLSAMDLGRLLGDHEPMRLALLNACEGAKGDSLDVFSSTAAVLVRRGTPAVVAMQYEITDEAAVEFSRAFYEAVADGMPVDASLSEARKAVAFAIPNTLEWGTPVLYMRAPDGVLFRIPAGGRPAESAAAAGDGKTAPQIPTDGKPVAAPPADEKATDGKPVAAPPAEEKATDGKPTEDAPVAAPATLATAPPVTLPAAAQGSTGSPEAVSAAPGPSTPGGTPAERVAALETSRRERARFVQGWWPSAPSPPTGLAGVSGPQLTAEPQGSASAVASGAAAVGASSKWARSDLLRRGRGGGLRLVAIVGSVVVIVALLGIVLLAQMPAITLSTPTGPGDVLTVSGMGFDPGELVDVSISGQPIGTAQVGSDGAFLLDVIVPPDVGGGGPVYARGRSSGSEASADLVLGAPASETIRTQRPIAFFSNAAGNNDLYVVEPDTGAVTQLTSTFENERFPAWSPDGSRIAYAGDVAGNEDIYVMNVDGTGIQRLTDDPAADWFPAWSPDGGWIAFASIRDDPRGDIYAMPSGGGDQVRLTSTPGFDRSPAWSPDGQSIAFWSERDGNPEIYTMAADGSTVQRRTGDQAEDRNPTWSPDGQWLAFVSDRGGDSRDIYRLELSTGNIDRLTDDERLEGNPAWSPDGARICFYRARSTADEEGYVIWVMNADGTNPRPLTDDLPGNALDPSWR
jgi:Tol biopolymer transport system component